MPCMLCVMMFLSMHVGVPGRMFCKCSPRVQHQPTFLILLLDPWHMTCMFRLRFVHIQSKQLWSACCMVFVLYNLRFVCSRHAIFSHLWCSFLYGTQFKCMKCLIECINICVNFVFLLWNYKARLLLSFSFNCHVLIVLLNLLRLQVDQYVHLFQYYIFIYSLASIILQLFFHEMLFCFVLRKLKNIHFFTQTPGNFVYTSKIYFPKLLNFHKSV